MTDINGTNTILYLMQAFMPNGIFHSYQLDHSIRDLKDVQGC